MYIPILGRALPFFPPTHEPLPAPEVKPARQVIDSVFDSTVSLLNRMKDRKRDLEEKILVAQEQLRQVEVIIDGASQMAQTVAGGLRPVDEKALDDHVATMINDLDP